MKKTLLLFLFLATYALTNAQYYTGFDSDSEQQGWNQYRFGEESDFYFWSLAQIGAVSDPNHLSHFYPVGGVDPTDNWYVSPMFDFSNGATIDSLYYNFSGFGTPIEGDTIALYVIEGSQDPSLASNQTILYNYTDSTYVNDGQWYYNSNIQIPVGSSTSYIAFRYRTVVNWLDVKFDNLRVDQSIVSVSEIPEANQFSVYPILQKDISSYPLKIREIE